MVELTALVPAGIVISLLHGAGLDVLVAARLDVVTFRAALAKIGGSGASTAKQVPNNRKNSRL